MAWHHNVPQAVIDTKRQAQMFASLLGVSVAQRVDNDGLYVALRSRRDPINTNRKRKYLTVRLRIGGVEAFRSDEECKGFPSEHLIAQLMLVV